MKSLFELNGKKAIITGAASGLGNAMAEAIHDAGAEVCLIDVSPNVEKIAKEMGAKGTKAEMVIVDLSNRVELKRGFEQAINKLNGIDILVNAAGINRRAKSEEFPIEDWDLVLEINLTSVFLLCQLAGKKMLEQGSGKIVNIASALSFTGGLTVPAYAASKGGIGQLTKTLANDWAGRGVHVNALAPGFMATPLTAALQGNPDREPAILARTPQGRWGKPEDLKGAVVFLCSAASDFVNGVLLPVDGGYLIR
jgi:2-deoxy-D-gluconate 3-dehydrogenase